MIVRKKERFGDGVVDDDTPYRYPRPYYLLAIFRAVGRRDAPTCAYGLTPRDESGTGWDPASLARLFRSRRDRYCGHCHCNVDGNNG